MFELAPQVIAWQNEQRPVWLVRVVSVTGMGSKDPAEATAVTEGLPAIGTILSGAADAALKHALDQAATVDAARTLDLRVGDAVAVAVASTPQRSSINRSALTVTPLSSASRTSTSVVLPAGTASS